MNRIIDLHGMTSDEVELELEMQFFEIKNPLSNILSVEIIFGNGKGILKQSVIHFIEKEGYKYNYLNSGSIKVLIEY